MKCRLCKIKEATNYTTKEFGICDECYIDIVSSFSYHIGGEEKTKEEYDKETKGII